MAQRKPTITFEDIPLDNAHRMTRGPWIDPELDLARKQNIQALDNTTARLTIPEGMSTATMKNCILRVAAELGIRVSIRKVPGGLLFWRSTKADLQQAKEVAQRLQTAQRKGRERPGRRRV
ncbi:MAG TPA: hypothetical protein VLK82_09520 [Candidatus Tectomicrobia bacterium]|nr:hypothetical protein [Candidatus Tectomicrobia bacterium]